MKSTLVCMHVLPIEFGLLEQWWTRYKKCLSLLDTTDNVTLQITLNLNPELTNWDASELSPDWFSNRFIEMFQGFNNVNKIIYDNSLKGTTQHKREAYEYNYDQFIFCDPDIICPPQLLRVQLMGSYELTGKYVISPSLWKWWDSSWDVLVDKRYITKSYSDQSADWFPEFVATQWVDDIYKEIQFVQIDSFKLGCGMHTLYSKEFWKFIEIPDSFGGYGPEDTFACVAANRARLLGYDLFQFRINGLIICENLVDNKAGFDTKVSMVDVKSKHRNLAEQHFNSELYKFFNRI